MGVGIKVTSGPVIQKAGDLAAILTHLKPRDILFIDEIHRLSRNIEEILYPALEDYQLDILIGKGPSAQSVRLKLKEFTLIGATTQTGRISSPLRTRCGIILRLGYYSADELCSIVTKAAKTLNIPIDKRAAIEIAGRSRGTPRIALRLLRRVRDYAQVKGEGIITLQMAQKGLKIMEIDSMGLDLIDHQMIKTIMDFHNGGPVGLETIALTLGEDVNTISDVYEPYLLQIGFLRRTARGRVLTQDAYKHFNKTPPEYLKNLSACVESGPVQENFDFN
jgi:Holliday junction DNA helicase RuvB